MGDNLSGTVTFLFTDIEGSTERWQADDGAMSDALASHDATIQAVVERHGGRVFKHTGDGMCAVFVSAPSAVAAAVEAQAGLGLPVRMGLHTGGAESRGGDFFGPTLNLTARVMDAGHGGQVLVSSATAGLVRDRVLVDLGEHRLKGLDGSERIFQVGDGEFPALRSLARLEHQLPAQRTEFIGRVDELEALTSLLRERSLVTVTAVGGAGKTRIAIQAGVAGYELFDAVTFVDLSTIDVDELVESEIGVSVGMPTGFGLVAFLAEWKGLLILDNCEHLIDACAEIVDELLVGCPGVTILATSRESLQVDGEQIFPLGSLDPATDGADLFVSRARLLDPSFDLDAADRLTVVEICARLDGLPLAIELAAGQSRHMSPAELLTNLGDRMTLLAGGRRRIGRQRTLEGAIDWSYEMLDEPDRLLLRRLSVFLGAVSVEEIASVCADEQLGEVAVRLHQLVDRNLVVSRPGEVVTLYSLLETIRIYAHDRLVAMNEQDAMRDRHLAAYMDRSVAMLASGGASAPQHFAFQLLNAAGAMDYAFDSGQDRPGVELYSLWGGLAEDGSELWAGRRKRAGAAAERIGAWATARVSYIDIERHWALGRPDETFRLADHMFETCSREDFAPEDGSSTGSAISSLWTYIQAYVAQGTAVTDPQRSRDLYDQAKAEEVAGDPWVDALLELARAFALLSADDLHAALEVIEADELLSSIPDAIGFRIAVLHSLDRHLDAAALLPAFDAGRVMMPMGGNAEAYAAVAAQFGGRIDDVDRRLETALLFARRFDSPYFTSVALMCLGAILRDRGQIEPARQFLNAAASLDTGLIPVLRVFREPHQRALGSSSGELDHVEPGWVDPENLSALIDAAILAIKPAPEPR